MKKLFKFIFKLALTCVLLLVCAVFVNNETDILSNPERYMSVICEKYPPFAEKTVWFSKELSRYTGDFPTVEKISANVRKHIWGSKNYVSNEYIKDSPLMSFYPGETIGLKLSDDYITVYGNTNDKNKVSFIALFTDEKDNELSQTVFSVDSDSEFAKKVSFPKTDKKRIQLSVYYCPKAYGEYRSWVIDYLYFEKRDDNMWYPEKSPVYENNQLLYEEEKSTDDALRVSQNIPSESEDIKKLSEQITGGCQTDYDKLIAIHDWICEYIYYDEDSLSGGNYPEYNPIEVINKRRGVCKGFAYLYATLARSAGIPCSIVSGYALGIDGVDSWAKAESEKTPNHAWNEAYADGRWIIIDTTWDCGNKIEGGETHSDGTSHLFFDANLQYFSANHKIIQYIYK